MPEFILTIAELQSLLAAAGSVDEKKAIRAVWVASEAAQKLSLGQQVRDSSLAIVRAMADLDDHVEKLARVGGLDQTRLKNMQAELDEIANKLGLRKTFISGDGAVAPVNDEGEQGLPPAPKAALEAPPAQVTAPQAPSSSSDYASVADEYVRYFQTLEVRSTHEAAVKQMVAKAQAMKNVYAGISASTGAPWWFIAGIHQMESTYRTSRHLHNGDPLTAKTVRVPKGRPVSGAPPFTWAESAADAFDHAKLTGLQDWSLPRALWRWERYNGFGYRKRGVPTPYLWSFSNHYLKGKFTSDGFYDGNAASAQCGAATMLKALAAVDASIDLRTDLVAEDEGDHQDQPTAATTDKTRDADAPPTHSFARFWADNLGDIQHFNWDELLYKGGSNTGLKLNTDPPEVLWANAIPLVRALEAFRNAIGHPVILTSVYRSPEYNKAIGGVKRSQHMAFRAADLKVSGGGGPANWANKLKELRDAGLFTGGVGVYNSFVHIDVRGFDADW